MDAASNAGIEVEQDDMYRLMRDQALTFIADMFLNMQENAI